MLQSRSVSVSTAFSCSSKRNWKLAVISANFLTTAVVLHLALSPGVGYRANFVATVSPAVWIAMMLLMGTVILLAWFSSNNKPLLYIACHLSTLLVLFPTLVTGTIYGSDSFVKAARAKRILSTGLSTNQFYPNMSAFSAMATLIGDFSLVSIPISLSVGFLAPFAGFFIGRALFQNQKHIRFLTAMSVFLPLGYGLWLSTRSLYHSYYLLFPLAVLAVGVMVHIDSSMVARWSIVAIIMLISLSLYHPLLFLLFCLITIMPITFIHSHLLLDNVPLIPSASRMITITITSIFFMYFQLQWILDRLTIEFLGSIGLFTRINTPSSVKCIDSQVSPQTCAAYTDFLLLALPLLLFSLSTGLVGYIIGGSIRSWYRNRTVSYQAIALSVSYIVVSGVFGATIVGVLPSSISLRLVAIAAVAILIILTKGVELVDTEISHTPGLLLSSVFLFGCITIAITPLIANTLFDGLFTKWHIIGFASIAAIAFFSYNYVNSSYRTKSTLLAVLTISVLFIPIMYPIPSVNGVSSHTWGIAEQSQTTWLTTYTKEDAQLATGSRRFVVHDYLYPNHPIPEYEGSVYALASLRVPPNSSQVRLSPSPQGQETDIKDTDYIALSGFTSQYVAVGYKMNNKTYRKVSGVSPDRVSQKVPFADRIYTSTNRSVVFRN